MFRSFFMLASAGVLILNSSLFSDGLWAGAGEKKPAELQAKGWATVKGAVMYDGEPPAVGDLRGIIAKSADKVFFMKAPDKDMLDPTWIVNKKNKGVANVVVWLKPPPGNAFKIPEADKVNKDTVILDRPFCAYVPHVVTLYPGRQDFKLVNSGSINHCPKWDGDLLINPGGSLVMKPMSEHVLEFKPQATPIRFTCSLHGWMQAYVWVFDHPYSAVTNADGVFVLPRVPAGAEVRVAAWHEAAGYVLGGKDGKAVTFKEGENQLDFNLKKR